MVCYGIFWSGQYQTKMVETESSLPLIIKKVASKPYQHINIQLNLSKAATLGTEENSHCWNKSECMDCPPTPPPQKKDSRCREVAFSGRSTVDFIGLLAQGHFINARVFSSQLFLMVPTEQIQTPSFLAWWIPVVYSLQRCLLFPERRVLLFIATVAAGLDLEVESILAFLTRLILIIAQLTWITHISCLLDRMPTPS